MFDYALRCKETDLAQLAFLAEALGVTESIDGQIVAKNHGIWDYIGYKYLGDTPGEGEADTRTILKQDNVPLVHINVRTPVNVRERAEEMALANPAIAEGLAQIPRFFITDVDGNAMMPQFPMRVFL